MWHDDTEDERRIWDGKITSSLVRINVGYVRDLLFHLDQFYNQETERLEDEIRELKREDFDTEADYIGYKGSLEDAPIEWWEVRELASELAIVGLYRIVENQTKRIVGAHFTPSQLRALHKWKNLKSSLLKKFQIDIECFPEYRAIDELRCLNNSIKHSGLVDGELAQYGWEEGKPLHDLDKAFTRLSGGVHPYLVRLDAEVKRVT